MGLKDILSGLGLAKRPVSVPAATSAPTERTKMLGEYYQDVRLRVSGGGKTNLSAEIRERSRPALPIKTYQRGQAVKSTDRGKRGLGVPYQGPIYDLREIGKARDVDSFVSTSIEKHVEIALQGGYSFDGDDEKALEYIKRRVFEIEFVSGISTRLLIEQILDNIASYGSAFVVVGRETGFNTGKPYKLHGKELNPISTWAVADAPTMKVAENVGGRIISWKQEVKETGYFIGSVSKDKTFHVQDVFVFTRHLQPGRVFGRSMYTPVLDDVMLLRALEDLVFIIANKCAFPLVQYIIGTKERPAKDIRVNGRLVSEVEYARADIESMPPEGMFVTPERHEIKIIGSEGEVLDLKPYIEHFRSRVQEGTRMSNAVLGTNTGDQSKSSAQTQQQGLKDSAQYYQDAVVDGFRWILIHLMLDGGFDVNYESVIDLSFGSSDAEATRAHENHAQDKFQAGILTEDEARRELGRRPLKESERSKLQPEQAHKRDKELAKMKAAQKASTAKKKATASKKSTRNKTRPSNQTKTKSTKTRVKANDFIEFVSSRWDWNRSKVAESGLTRSDKFLEAYLRAGSDGFLQAAIQRGVERARADLGNAMLFLPQPMVESICVAAVAYLMKSYSERMDSTGTIMNDLASLDAAKEWFLDCAGQAYRFAGRSAYIACAGRAGREHVLLVDSNGNSSATMSCASFSDVSLYRMGPEKTLKA